MIRAWISAVLAGLVVLSSGCATRTGMAFENDSDKYTEQNKPVYLMTATIRKSYRTSFQPKLVVVNVEKPDAKEAADRLNFKMDEKGRRESDNAEAGNSYLIRLELDPGRYELVGLTSLARSFPINGFFMAPVHAQLEVREPGIYYLGHIEATVRERTGNEFKAGPLLPLIDQAVAGASGGTFDITITDALATDEPLFRARFPALANVKIVKAVLPPFDRQKAQAWWEAH